MRSTGRCRRPYPFLAALCLSLALYSGATTAARAEGGSTYEQLFADPAYLAKEEGLSDSAKVGRRIWLYATAGNARFHTYVFQQRLGVLIDWYRVLNTEQRDERFSTWGLINDPGCCVPGSDGCPATKKEDTYGFDWCTGDAELLAHVGKSGYHDPACDLADVPVPADDPHGSKDQRQSACDLAFGTSTGVMGLRKFPNPKFDPARWQKLNGSMATWKGYEKQLDDGSIEPPFLIGMACGACHIAFDPLHPPADPEHPTWENIDALVGNQYSRMSEIMASGMSTSSLEWQIFSHARPGTVDTSAVANDGVNNPRPMNAIINFGKRPLHPHDVIKWHKVASCPAGSNDSDCWCEPGRDNKCWKHSEEQEMVPNILKGGEDSIGFNEAVQRVYINIGSCSEQGWVNHLVDLRQADPEQRLFHQTPFDIGQVRRDCANFRAIEDRLPDLVAFLVSERPTDLYVARGLASRADLEKQLDTEFGAGAVQKGRAIFAEKCARCHASKDSKTVAIPSSVALDPIESRDFLADDPDHPGMRLDWLGNDELTAASEVGTYRARSLHSNHMTGHVWQQYGSETLRSKPPVADIPEPVSRKDGGRGYYRNISLLSVWAHAPFLHNNAIGPELCGPVPASDPGWASDPRRNLYRSPYVSSDANGELVLDDNGNPVSAADAPKCWAYDPSVDGRFALFKESVRDLLNPKQRMPKITRLAEDVVIPIGPRYVGVKQGSETGIEVRIPQGTPAVILANLNHKALLKDLVLASTDKPRLRAELVAQWGDKDGAAAADQIEAMLAAILKSPGNVVEIAREYRPEIQKLYSNSTAIVENTGHLFGEDLSDQDKDSLTAFLATL